MLEVQASAKAWLTVEFFDKNNDPVVPNTVTYTVTDVLSGNVLRASTPVSPAASIEIELDSTDTVMVDAVSNESEPRKVCVTANYGAGDSLLSTYRFKVIPESC